MNIYDALAEPIKPPFGWPGGKIRLVPDILPLLPMKRGYCEVFGGAGAVLLNRPSVKFEVFNDIYSQITNFYIVLKEQPAELEERLLDTIYGRDYWQWCKDTYMLCEDEVERAARWFYTIRYSFNQLGRNFGRDIKISGNMSGKIIRQLPEFRTITKRLRSVCIENRQWYQCFKDYDCEEMTFYCDPPYLNVHKGTYKYDEIDHEDFLKTVMKAKGTVVVSGEESDLYRSFKWDKIVELELTRMVQAAAFTEGNSRLGKEGQFNRVKGKEILWVKL